MSFYNTSMVFPIGSNDLTQLTLGLDRDSDLVASLFDERNAAVKALLHQAIAACNKANKYVGICGQGPSDHPDLAAMANAGRDPKHVIKPGHHCGDMVDAGAKNTRWRYAITTSRLRWLADHSGWCVSADNFYFFDDHSTLSFLCFERNHASRD